MGAEQSLEKGRDQLSLKAIRDARVPMAAEHRASVEPLSDDFKNFLREKQDEYKQLVEETQGLRLEIVANKLAYGSIVKACVAVMDKSDTPDKQQLAEIIAWKSIALGADNVLEGIQNKRVSLSE